VQCSSDLPVMFAYHSRRARRRSRAAAQRPPGGALRGTPAASFGGDAPLAVSTWRGSSSAASSWARAACRSARRDECTFRCGPVPVFARAAELGAAIFVHPGNDGRGEDAKYWCLLGACRRRSRSPSAPHLRGVLERLPRCGSRSRTRRAFPGTFDGRARLPPRRLVRSTTRLPRRLSEGIYVVRWFHDARRFTSVLELFGAERWRGQRLPFPLGETPPGALIDSMSFTPSVPRNPLRSPALARVCARRQLRTRS